MDYKHCYWSGKYAHDRLCFTRLHLGQMRYVSVYIFDNLTEGVRWIVCNKKGFVCASSNTSTSRLPAMGPRNLEYQQPDWTQARRLGLL